MKIHLFISTFVLIICCSACKTIERIEYVDRNHYIERSDTLIQYDRDSIFVNQFVKGDTVFKTKYVEKIKYKDRIVIERDTLKITNTKTIKETVKVVPDWCYKSIIGLLFLCIGLGFWIYLKR